MSKKTEHDRDRGSLEGKGKKKKKNSDDHDLHLFSIQTAAEKERKKGEKKSKGLFPNWPSRDGEREGKGGMIGKRRAKRDLSFFQLSLTIFGRSQGGCSSALCARRGRKRKEELPCADLFNSEKRKKERNQKRDSNRYG